MTASSNSRVFNGGQGLFRAAAAAAVIGLGGTAVLTMMNPAQGMSSYLVAYMYWLSIGVCSLAWVMAFHAARAKWVVLIRRIFEVIPTSLAGMGLLFIPIVLGLKHLYIWSTPDAPSVSEELRKLLEHKQAYLNVSAFVVRAVIYFAIWLLFSNRMLAWSLNQDKTGDLAYTRKSRKLGAGGLPVLGLSITFAAFDWLMSLSPGWYSTIFGLYYIAGGLIASIATLVLVLRAAERAGWVQGMTPGHWHSLGKLLHAFVCFWAYMGFSQFLLVWVGNLPEELPWYLLRAKGGWAPIGIFIAVFHFGIPFLMLMSRDIKRDPNKLAIPAIWMLFMHFVDTYWMVMPVLHPDRPHPAMSDLLAWIGVGGVAVLVPVLILRGRYPVPQKDPFLGESLRYDPQ
jgi:hypothetical protein